MKKNIEREILVLTGISQEQRSRMIFENAYRFLERYIGQDDWATNYITYSKTFWAWWMKQWEIRDEIFIARMKNVRYNPEKMLQKYELEHSPCHLACQPPVSIIHEEYSRMIDDVHKEWIESKEIKT